jgi:hypothetical protein
MSRQDHEKNKRMRETVDQLMNDPLCGICGQSYRKHKAFMENCPLLSKGEFCADVYFSKKKTADGDSAMQPAPQSGLPEKENL